MESIDKDQAKKKVNAVKIFPVPFDNVEIQDNIDISTNTLSTQSRERIINQAFKFHSQGNIIEASKYYKYFISQGFKDERVFFNYGVILNDLGQLKDAELSTRKAINLNPDFTDAYYSLGIILQSLGKLQDAEISYRKAIELNPDFTDAYYNLGNILKDGGKLQDAEISYRKAIELNPDLAKAHCNLGIILRDLGKSKEAEISYRKAIELNTIFGEAYFNLGIVLQESSKLNEALHNYKKAKEYKIEPKICLKKIGEVLLNQGKHIEGLRYLREGEGAIIFDIENGLSKI